MKLGVAISLLLHISISTKQWQTISAFGNSSPILNFRPSSSSTLCRALDTETIVDAIENVECSTAAAATTLTPRKKEPNDDDIIINGTAKRVQQNPLGKFSDFVSSAFFSILHYDDSLGIKDSSKNLRVLWSRAFLNHVGSIKDDIAWQLLPASTRGIIKILPKSGPLVNFQEFIVSRTEFIDGAVDSFLQAANDKMDSEAEGGKKMPQIVLFGAGYDTRSLRYNGKADFFEVDLPDVVDGKGKLQQYWKSLNDAKSDDNNIILPTKIGYDLNDAADPEKPTLTDALTEAGLKADVPTLFIWEAVLFYVKPEAVMRIFDNVFNFGDDSAVCLVDSLKPAVTTSFLHKAREFFDGYNLDVIDHNSRWGGAVHFAFAGRKESPLTATMQGKREQLPFSYLATSVDKSDTVEPSFNNQWYAVAFPWQVNRQEVYSTRLWGEPIVLYRDAIGNLVCAKDSCPHRSAPLSMSKLNSKGQLECMYHGWAFGVEGACESVPTQAYGDSSKASRKSFMQKACLKTYAVEEHENLIWVWRGNVLEADATKLPKTRKDVATYPCDTILDYNVDWQYIVENNLDSPHLFWLHNGSVPPVRSLNFVRDKIDQVQLKLFQDDSGRGHYGQTSGGKPKIVRFDAPNIVRHGGVSSFSEEFHIVPIAPGRTRVLLRQNLPQGPILSTILSIPGSEFFLQKLVNMWNYHIALEDYAIMQGQAHNVDDLGAPHLALGDLGDDLVSHFYRWKDSAEMNDGTLPYFSKWDGKSLTFKAAATDNEVSQDTQFAVVDDGERLGGKDVGTYGILKSYSQKATTELYPPVNYKMYKPFLDLDQAFRSNAPGNEDKDVVVDGKILTAGVLSMAGVGVSAAVALAQGPLGGLPASLLLSWGSIESQL